MRPERCHLPVRVVGEKHAAFESGVDGLDGGRLAVDFGAERDQFFHQFGVRLRFPAGVGAAILPTAADQGEERFETGNQFGAGAIHGGAQHAEDVERLVVGFDGSEVV